MSVDDAGREAARWLFDQAAELPLPTLTEPGRRAQHRRVIAISVCVAVLAVTVLAVLLDGKGSGSRVNAGSKPGSSSGMGGGPQAADRGGTWTAISATSAGFDPGAHISAVTTFAHKLVAVGAVGSGPGVPAEIDGTAAAWLSSDGRHWSRVGMTRFGRGTLQTVAAGDGAIIALGNVPGSDAALQVWSSTDATSWHLLASDAPVGIRQVLSGGPGFIAVGQTTIRPGVPSSSSPVAPSQIMNRTTIWTSIDGRRWQKVPGNQNDFPSGSIGDVVKGAQGFVAIGSLQASTVVSKSLGPGIWTSRDGTTWQRDRAPIGLGSAQPTAIAVNDRGQLLLVGYVPTPNRPPPTTGPPPTIACPSHGSCEVLLTGVLNGYTASWSSADGHHWQLLTGQSDPFGEVAHVIFAHHEWIVAARNPSVSSDGRSWITATTSLDLGGEPQEVAYATSATSTNGGAIVTIGRIDRSTPSGQPPNEIILYWTP